jgi:electron transfer flavoprotein beta subunit
MVVKIAVMVKQVPDTNVSRRLDADDTLARDSDLMLDPGDECAVEIALQLREANGGEVVLVSMGPPSARDAIRKGLAMGADRGTLVSDDGLAGADALNTARVLAAAVGPHHPDLVICGTESYDGSTGLVPPMLAELLGVPQLTFATSVHVSGDVVTVHRRIDDGYEVIEAPMPAVITVTAAIAEPRYPTLKNIMAARSKTVDQVGLDGLGVSPGAAVETVEQIVDADVRAGGVVVEDDGESGVSSILDALARAQVV